MKHRSSAVARSVAAVLVLVALPLLEGTAPSGAASASPRCAIVGTPGIDRLAGTSRRDVICGRGGHDRIVGRGGDGTDVVLGGPGNDDLTGGPKADRIDGGTGTNWCLLDAVDVADRCVYDRKPAVADRVTVSAETVDVTLADRSVTIRVHVTDDTGAKFVRITPGAGTPWFPATNPHLSSGTVRDGWWTATLTLRRWSMPGTYVPRVIVWDRLDRRSETDFPGSSIEVLDDTPDTEQPEVTLMAPHPTTEYDVRTTGVQVKWRARIVDPLSGVGSVSVALWAPRHNGAMTQAYVEGARLTSGTIRDGIWTGSIYIPKGEVGGDWNFQITVDDRTRDGSNDWLHYWGPGEFFDRGGNPAVDRPLPHGMGSVNVIGRLRTDSTPPTVSSASLSPASVDTLPGPATVNVSVQASDNGSGVDGIYAEIIPAVQDGSEPMYISGNPDLSSGTPANGTWTGTITLPQGLPPGTYYLKIVLWDRDTNTTSYIASGHPEAGHWTNHLSSNPTVTVIDSSP